MRTDTPPRTGAEDLGDLEHELSLASADDFRSAMRQLAGGVVVVTAAADGELGGVVVTSLVSAALNPPMVMFSLSRSVSSWPIFERAETLVANLLSQDQQQVARRFTQRGIDRFAPPTETSFLPSGEPYLLGSAAWLRGRVVNRIDAGDHVVVLAAVTDTHVGTKDSLVYWDGDYRTIAG